MSFTCFSLIFKKKSEPFTNNNSYIFIFIEAGEIVFTSDFQLPQQKSWIQLHVIFEKLYFKRYVLLKSNTEIDCQTKTNISIMMHYDVETYLNIFRWYASCHLMNYWTFSHNNTTLRYISLREKCLKIWSYFLSVFSCIRTEYMKIQTRHNSVFGHFSRSDFFLHWGKANQTLGKFYKNVWTGKDLERLNW